MNTPIIRRKKIRVTVPKSRPLVTLENMCYPLLDDVIETEVDVKVYPYQEPKKKQTKSLRKHWIIQDKRKKYND